jgi:hypothetical protein
LWRANTFQLAHHLWNLIDNINDTLGPQSWKRQDLIVEEDSSPICRPFYYRNPLECIRLLLRHLPFKNHLTWAPRREYTDRSRSQRVYHEMYTGDYWWTEQENFHWEQLLHAVGEPSLYRYSDCRTRSRAFPNSARSRDLTPPLRRFAYGVSPQYRSGSEFRNGPSYSGTLCCATYGGR